MHGRKKSSDKFKIKHRNVYSPKATTSYTGSPNSTSNRFHFPSGSSQITHRRTNSYT